MTRGSGGIDVLVDVQAVGDQAAGVPNVARNLVPALIGRGDGVRYYVAGREDTLSGVLRGSVPAASSAWIARRSNPAYRVVSQHFLDGLRVNRIRPRIYYALATLLPFGISRRTAQVSLIHDLAPFRVEGIYTASRMRYHKWLLRSVASRADHIVTVSHATRTDVMEILGVPPDRVTAIPIATDAPVWRPSGGEPESHRRRLGLPERYLLFVGKIQPRKNLGRLIEAFGILAGRPDHADLELVIVGKRGWLYGDILATYERSPAKARIRFTGEVGDADLPWYYRCAGAFCFPSLYEGFGLPILEAMANGVPVVTSDFGATAEVAGDAGITCDPRDPGAMAAAIKALLDDPEARATAVARGYARVGEYGWDRCAAGYAALWKRFA